MIEPLQPQRQPGKRVRRSQYVKRCHACREKVPADARKCRHCGELLDKRRRTAVLPPKKPLSTCVILLIVAVAVVPFIAIVAAIAIPNLLASKKTVNEVAAVSTLRTLSFAQEVFVTKYSRYGSFDELQGMGVIDMSLAQATTPERAKSGYCYALKAGEDAWSCTAVPAVPGTTGRKSYYIDQSGVIRSSIMTSSYDEPADENSFPSGGW